MQLIGAGFHAWAFIVCALLLRVQFYVLPGVVFEIILKLALVEAKALL